VSVEYVAMGSPGKDEGSLSVQSVARGSARRMRGLQVCNLLIGGPRGRMIGP
jgi:hypothetical protein